jgi:hypothetical protein
MLRFTAATLKESLVMDAFGCSYCGSHALNYPKSLQDEEPVVCAKCGKYISTYGEIKQRADQADRVNARSSGC